MALRSKNKVKAEFSMASMTDVIFLLLIFFMLTSNFVKPLVHPVNLPGAKNGEVNLTKIVVTVNKDLKYFVDEEPVTLDNLKSKLARKIGKDQGNIVLNIDKGVPVEYLVNVSDIAISLKAKVTLAVEAQ